MGYVQAKISLTNKFDQCLPGNYLRLCNKIYIRYIKLIQNTADTTTLNNDLKQLHILLNGFIGSFFSIFYRQTFHAYITYIKGLVLNFFFSLFIPLGHSSHIVFKQLKQMTNLAESHLMKQKSVPSHEDS